MYFSLGGVTDQLRGDELDIGGSTRCIIQFAVWRMIFQEAERLECHKLGILRHFSVYNFTLQHLTRVLGPLWGTEGMQGLEMFLYQNVPFWCITIFLPSQIIIIITNPLTTRAVGTPQMISQPLSSIFPCSPLSSGTWWTPGLSIPRCCPPTSSVCRVFFPHSLCVARWFWTVLMNGRHDHTILKQSKTKSIHSAICHLIWSLKFTFPAKQAVSHG